MHTPHASQRRFRFFTIARLLLATAGAGLLASPAAAQIDYQLPSQPITDIVDAATTPRVSVSPDYERLLLLEQPSLPPLSELAEPELKLAGMRISPRTFGPSRGRPASGLSIVDMATGEARNVTGLPSASAASPLVIENARWSPDARRVAFTLLAGDRIEPWVLDAATGVARQVAAVRLNLAARVAPQWMPDSRGLVVAEVIPGGAETPQAPRIPTGPIVEETAGRKAPARTYQDLLKDGRDEALFEHYFSAQLTLLGLDGTRTLLGSPGLVWDATPSPSGEMILVESLHRPFSYQVPASRFPRAIDVLDRTGKQVHRVADLPLHDAVPMAFGSVPTGPRSVHWRADAAATLVWVEALDGGDARAAADERDRMFTHAAPFNTEPKELATLGSRYAGEVWGENDQALITERWWQTRQVKVWSVTPSSGDAEVMFDRSYEDRYSDPGNPETVSNEAGRRVLLTSNGGQSLYLLGAGASPEGDRPFVDRYDVESRTTERLFHSAAPHYEQPVQLIPDGKGAVRWLLTRRESPSEPPNYFLRDLGDGNKRSKNKPQAEPRQLTHFAHPTPQLTGLNKELIKYQRADGVELTGTLYTPPGWTKDQGPLPMVMWAYPREFKSAQAASQVRDSPYRFDRINYWSQLLWLTKGYAVLDNPALPIVGEADEEPNNTHVQQLVQGARAAVDEVVRRGVADRDRIAIGGHSYGAFMTANLLAHSDLFATGIARSGAYNRTLTPFGFQAEQRSFWKAPEIYFAMSPFMHAEKINEPILFIHGAADNNSGTFPMQSERMYAAVKGNGGTARLVMLPLESHGYRSRESLLHMLWEQESWLERWIESTDDSSTTSSSADR